MLGSDRSTIDSKATDALLYRLVFYTMALVLLLLLLVSLLTVAMPYAIAADTLGHMSEMSSIMDCFGADG